MKAYTSILSAMRSQVWAVDEAKLHGILGFLAMKAQGQHADAAVIAELHGASEIRAARAQKVSQSSKGSVAVLPIYGLILHRGSSMGDISGPAATSTLKLLSQFRQAVNDPGVQAIVLDIDSPGGTVEGVEELAAEIRASRGKKQTIAVSNKQCCSAAYYIASACDEIVASPSSTTGSVGVYCAHEDVSKYLENMGVKVSIIKFGENKAEGNPYEPLTDSARAHMQEMVDLYGNMFEKAVAKGRKISQTAVHDGFGQGLSFGAEKAKKLGMVDSVGTLDDVLARFGVTMASSSTSMEADAPTRMDKLNGRRNPEGSTSGLCGSELCDVSGNITACCREPIGHDGPHADPWAGMNWGLDLVDGNEIARSHAAMKRRLEIAAA